VPSPVSRSELLKGARFGAHEVVSLIGHGATASVFEGTHVALGKKVAIKILHDHLAADGQIAGRFVREGRVAAKLHHPNAVEVFDVGVEQGIPFLVMELLIGNDLRALLADTGRLELEHALAFLLPIASALAYAHDAGVIHRDLKPANIFLARDVRDDVVPKLVDFGLSKAAGIQDASPTLTEMVAGTVLYMAPEQTLGMKFATAASDQYSLAAILYESLTGRPPFTGTSLQTIIERIRSETPERPTALASRLPKAIDAPILRALAREPQDRFANVREFARALLPFAPHETVASLERDFADRASGSPRVASRPSLRRAAAESPISATTRVESKRTATPGDHGVAPLPCAPGASPFHMKGNPYRGVLYFATNKLAGGLDALCDAFEDRRIADFLRQPFLATALYDVLPLYPITAALARLSGQSLDAFVRHAAAAQARYDARTVYKSIFHGTEVNDIPLRISRFNSRYYDFGEFVGVVGTKNRFSIEHRAIPAYVLPWWSPMNEAYTAECARIRGANEVTSVATAPVPAGSRDRFDLASIRIDVEWK
jgi:serine/threonine protein kinase